MPATNTLPDFYYRTIAELEAKKKKEEVVSPIQSPPKYLTSSDATNMTNRSAYPGGIMPDEYAEYVNPDYGRILGMLVGQGNKNKVGSDTRALPTGMLYHSKRR